MKNKSVEITKIKLQLGQKEIELTVEQAKKLKASLDELFGKEVIKEVHHDRWNWRYRWPYWYDYTYTTTAADMPRVEYGNNTVTLTCT
jgi:hypothetical protein